jgi:hypothetical protein
MPAIGGMNNPIPGTNLEIKIARREYTDCNLKMYVSGSSERLLKNLRRDSPRRPPKSYQSESLTSDATVAKTNAPAKFRRPNPARAPAAIRIGTEGTGKPICSAITTK